MALITTTSSLKQLYTPFTGLSAAERAQSGIARAELVYYAVNEDWDPAGTSNEREFTTGLKNLPTDYGHILTDAFVEISAAGDGSVDIDMVGGLRLYPGGVLGPIISTTLEAVSSKQDASGTTAIGSMTATSYNTSYPQFGNRGVISFAMKNKPTAMLYPFNSQTYTSAVNPASIFQFSIGEQVKNNLATYNVTSYFRFLQYDIDQSYNYVIQSPQLTR